MDHRPHPADERDAEGGDTADQDRPARAKRRTHPSDKRRSDRRSPQEHEGVQSHDAPTLIGVGARLHERVRTRIHRQHAKARGDRQEGKPPVRGRQTQQDLGGPVERGTHENRAQARSAARSARGSENRTEGHEGRENAEGAGGFSEDRRRHERARHLEVHAQGTDDEDQREDDANVGATVHVDHGLAQLAAGARDQGARVEPVTAHEGQRDDGSHEHDRVDHKDRADPPPVDEQARGGRADQARGMEGGGIQGHGVRHLLVGHELSHKGLARRGIDGGDRARDKRQDVLVPEFASPRQDDDADNEGHEADPRLRTLQEAAPRDAIREDPRPRGEQDNGEELERRHEAHLRRVVIGEDRQDVPVLGDALEPHARGRDQGGDEPVPVVHVAHGRKRCRHADPPSLTPRTERGRGWRCRPPPSVHLPRIRPPRRRKTPAGREGREA